MHVYVHWVFHSTQGFTNWVSVTGRESALPLLYFTNTLGKMIKEDYLCTTPLITVLCL